MHIFWITKLGKEQTMYTVMYIYFYFIYFYFFCNILLISFHDNEIYSHIPLHRHYKLHNIYLSEISMKLLLNFSRCHLKNNTSIFQPWLTTWLSWGSRWQQFTSFGLRSYSYLTILIGLYGYICPDCTTVIFRLNVSKWNYSRESHHFYFLFKGKKKCIINYLNKPKVHPSYTSQFPTVCFHPIIFLINEKQAV